MAWNDLIVRVGMDSKGFTDGTMAVKRNTKGLQDGMVALSRTLTDQQGKLRELGKAGLGAHADYKKLKEEIKDGRAQFASMTRELRTLENQQRSTGKSAGMMGDMMGKGLALAGGYLSGIGLAELGRGAATQIFGFEQSLANLQAIAGATSTELEGLEKTARDLGGSTSFTAAQVVDLQTELSKLGFSIPEIKSLSGSVVNLATALGADAGEAAVILGGQLRAFGKEASSAAEFAEILGATANMSAVDFDDFALMLPKVSKAAATVGWDFAQLNAALGILRDQNIRAEAAGTGLRNVLLKNSEAGRTYKQGLDLITNSTDKLKTATELYGSENAIVALTLANAGSKVDEAADKIRGMTGTLAEMNRVKLDTVQGQFKLLTSAVSELLLTLNNGTSLKGFVSAAGDAIKALTQLAKYGSVLGKDFDDQLIRNKETVDKYGAAYSKMIAEGKMSTADFISMMDKQIATKEKIIAQYPKARAEIKANMKAQLDSLKALKETVLSGGKPVAAVGGEEVDASGMPSTTGKTSPIKTAASEYQELQKELIKTKEYLDFVGQSTDYVGDATSMIQGKMESIFKMGGAEAVKYAQLLKDQMRGLVDSSRTGDHVTEKVPTLNLLGGVQSETTTLPFNSQPVYEMLEAVNQLTIAKKEMTDADYLALEIQNIQIDSLYRLGDAMSETMEAIGAGAMSASDGMKAFGKAALLAGLEAAKGSIIAASAEYLKTTAKLGPVGLAIAAGLIGGAFGLLKGAVSSSKGLKLAKGGLAYGETQATIGDNPGARFDPEVVAPLSKLEGMLDVGGTQNLTGTFRIHGDDLVLAYDNAQRKTKAFRV